MFSYALFCLITSIISLYFTLLIHLINVGFPLHPLVLPLPLLGMKNMSGKWNVEKIPVEFLVIYPFTAPISASHANRIKSMAITQIFLYLVIIWQSDEYH